MNVLVLSFVTTICLFQHTTALYFHIGETERKCFIEEVPDETNVMVNYKVELYDPKSRGLMPSSPGIAMHIEVRDPDDKMILSRVYSSEGRILFTSHTHGKYVFCMYSNSSARFNSSRLMVHLDIQIGERTVNYSDVVLKEKLSELQLRVGQFLDQVEEIIKEVNYRRYRGQCIRETSESTNSRVLWLSVTKITVALLMGAWQMRHLKCFFEAIKLV